MGLLVKLILAVEIFRIYTCSAYSELDYFKAFDDSLTYRMHWEKEAANFFNEGNVHESLETISMVTNRNEKYTCSLPKMLESKKVSRLINFS